MAQPAIVGGANRSSQLAWSCLLPGSFMAALATDIAWTIVGRAIQGAGAISAAVTAFIADSTRDEHRTKAMALVGGSVALTFAGSLVLAPLLYPTIGVRGLFALTGVLVVIAIGVLFWVVPAAPGAAVKHDEVASKEAVFLDGAAASPQRRHFRAAHGVDGNVCCHSSLAGSARIAAGRALEDLLSGRDVVVRANGQAADRGRASRSDAASFSRLDRARTGSATGIPAYG